MSILFYPHKYQILRIAIIVPAFPVSSETFIVNKIKALVQRGHIIKVFAGKLNDPYYKLLFHDSKNISTLEISLKKFSLYCLTSPSVIFVSITTKNPIKFLYNRYRSHAVNQFRPDIVHFEFSGIGIEFLNIMKQLTGKKVVSCRGSAEKVKLLYKHRKEQLTALLKIVDSVHCVSTDMASFIKSYSDLPGKLFVNYPGINTRFFNAPPLNESNKVPVILSVGRFIFQKGYFIGLLAVKKLSQLNINFKWKIIAAGPLHEEILYHIYEMKLENAVEIAGIKTPSEILQLMQGADIFFLPSVSEGIANVVLEAMSMQLPVVSTNCGGMAEVITHGKNGLLADVYDYEALAENIACLINNPERARALGIAARMHIEEQFTLERQTDIFENIYQQLIAG